MKKPSNPTNVNDVVAAMVQAGVIENSPAAIQVAISKISVHMSTGVNTALSNDISVDTIRCGRLELQEDPNMGYVCPDITRSIVEQSENQLSLMEPQYEAAAQNVRERLVETGYITEAQFQDMLKTIGNMNQPMVLEILMILSPSTWKPLLTKLENNPFAHGSTERIGNNETFIKRAIVSRLPKQVQNALKGYQVHRWSINHGKFAISFSPEHKPWDSSTTLLVTSDQLFKLEDNQPYNSTTYIDIVDQNRPPVLRRRSGPEYSRSYFDGQYLMELDDRWGLGSFTCNKPAKNMADGCHINVGKRDTTMILEKNELVEYKDKKTRTPLINFMPAQTFIDENGFVVVKPSVGIPTENYPQS